MPGLQDWIHKLEEGEWVRYIKMGVVVLGLLGLTVVYDIREFKNFNTQEAMDGAQLARNISEGNGYTTDFIRPLSIYMLQKHRGEEAAPVLRTDHPDLANPPVYPLLLAGFMMVAPFEHAIPASFLSTLRYQPEVLIAFLNQFLFFVAAFMVFRLARRLFDSGVAWVSALIVVGADLLWRFSVSGLSTMLLIVIFLGVVWCLVTLEQNQREGKRANLWFILMAVLTGALVGLGGLTRYSFSWLIIPVAAFLALYFGGRRVALSLAAVAACLLVISPWLARNYQQSGTLFGIAGYAVYYETDPFQGNRLERFLNESFEQEASRAEFRQFVRKLIVNSGQIIQNEVPKLGGSWVSAFFLAGLLLPFRSVALTRFRLFLLMCLAVLIVAQALGRTHLSTVSPEINSENLLVLLAPVVFIFGVAMYFILLDQISLPFPQLRNVVTGVFWVFTCAPLIFTLLPPPTYPVTYPPYWPPGIQDISKWMKEDELMMSDMPWAVAWYGNRKCIWVTVDAPFESRLQSQEKSDFFTIYDYQKPIQGLYLTTLTTDARFYSQMLKDKDYAWGRFMLECLLRTNVPTGFPLKAAPRGFLQHGQLFLTDHERWKKPLQ
ncbi:MAG: hypothetical protein FJ403_12410 [Verrucomicrobia bacterium]|nr:hypothetical protein [Verrucomicrobiota bacterium]